MNKKEVSVSYSFLRRCALIFVLLPLLCFFLGWLKWYWAAITGIALVFCLLMADGNGKLSRLFKKKTNSIDPDEPDALVISKKLIVLIVLISCAYLIFCGVGRLWAQSDDHLWRNAIFRDLITHDWPVYYDRYNGALSYYVGAWLPAAIPGKIAFLLSADTEIGFRVGNISFLIYYTFGLSVLFLLLLMFFKTADTKKVLFIFIGFVLFSGMDIVGKEFKVDYDHIEWWAKSYQYSSLTTCLCWVFNQSLIPWICTMLLLHEKNISNYVLIGMACLFAGPFPFIGFFIYCVALGIKRLVDLIKAKKGKQYLTELFSISNICSILFIFPAIGTYFTSNTMMSNQNSKTFFLPPTWEYENYVVYILFLLLEYGIYALLILLYNKRNFLFYITLLQLAVYPLFGLGIHSDFTMRASIPGIFMMYVFCYQYLTCNTALIPVKNKDEKQSFLKRFVSRVNILYVTLVLLLVLGAVTPGIELWRGVTRVRERGIDDYLSDCIVTLDQDSNPLPHEDIWPATNFVALDYENTLFFKVFAKK